MILQHLYKPVLNFIYEKITFRVSERIRDIILLVSFFLLFFVQFGRIYTDLYNGGVRDYMVVLLMGVIILFSVDRRMELLKWRMVIYVPFVLMGLYMLFIAVCFHSVGDHYTVFIFYILVITICLAFIWGNRGDYERLFTIVASAYTLFFIVILVWCLARYGLYFGQSYTMWMNTNGFVKLICPAVACSMYLFLIASSIKWKAFFAVICGAASVMIVFTTCKTAQIVLLLLFIILIVLLVLQGRETGRKPGKSFLCFLIACVLGFGATTGFLHIVTPIITNDPVATHVNEYKMTMELSDEPIDMNSPYQVYKRETIEEISQYPLLKKLDDIGTGRIHMWAMYLKRLNMTGNVKTLRSVGPHNQYVELTYRAGLPAGVMWLFILFAVFILIIHGIVKRKGDWIYFATLQYPAFLFFSMLETGIFPMDRGFITMYYLALIPMLIKTANDKEEKHEQLS